MHDVTPEHTKAEQEPAPIKAKSKGEKTFDRVVYGGLAALGTFIVTIPITYLLKYHAPVQPYFSKVVDVVERGLKKMPFKTTRETADKIVTTTALMQGGNMMLLPIGIAEHHKVPIVGGLNTMYGDPTPVEQIEQAPKQTWLSLIESRVVAWLAVFGAFKAAEKFVPKTLVTFEDEVGKRMCDLFKKPQERMIAGKMVPSKTYLFGKIGALDFFATIAAATFLYVGGHFFARKQEQKKERRETGHLTEGREMRDGVLVDKVEPMPVAESTLVGSQIRGAARHDGLVAPALQPQVSPVG